MSHWSLSRLLISRSGNLYVRLVLGLPVHDTTAGCMAFRRNALERIGAVKSASNGYCFQVEYTRRAVRLGLRVTEVPITFTDRTVGTPKMSGTIVAEALTQGLVWRWNESSTAQGRDSESTVPVATHEGQPPPTRSVRTTSRPSVMPLRELVERLLTREVSLFVLFDIIGFGFSIVALVLSHDVLGLTSRRADNISANVVGLALGTVFRYLTYKRFVFATPPTDMASVAQTSTELPTREVPVA